MSLGFDPEVPAGFQDADLEMRELEEAAREREADPPADDEEAESPEEGA